MPKRIFTPFNISLTIALNRLIEKGILKPLDSMPIPNPIPSRYNVNQYCAYHQGQWHLTDNCLRLCHQIQDLFYNKIIPISNPVKKPNVTNNPLPNHAKLVDLNCIQKEPPFDPSFLICSEFDPKPLGPFSEDRLFCLLIIPDDWHEDVWGYEELEWYPMVVQEEEHNDDNDWTELLSPNCSKKYISMTCNHIG
ncbi:hypothetical protein U1Q18_052378 [Sarracenia purpurea var. burkii]